MTRKSGLGKGLDALIPGGDFLPEPASLQPSIQYISVKKIFPNPHQPRTRFDSAELADLATSVREVGILQPLLVTRGDAEHEYILIAGERRLMAARQAGLETVPVILREANDLERTELALIENVQRADLSPLETAEAYRQLAEDFGLPHEKIAERVGKSRASITNTLRLLKLPEAVRESLANGQISEGHARALLALTSSQAQIAALQTVLRHDMNVRQTEELVRKLTGQKPPAHPKPVLPPELAAVEEKLRHGLSTKVTLNQGRRGGTLVIYYYSDEELNALVGKILDEE